MNWLRSLKLDGVYQETLDEYLLTYDYPTAKLDWIECRIEELAAREEDKEGVQMLSCFLGVKTFAALSVIVETGDFKRFASAPQYAAYLGLIPGKDSGGDDLNRLPITKAGNRHLRMLLVEAVQCYGRGQIGHKSKNSQRDKAATL